MPRLNRTGPTGKGPRTGLGQGRCKPGKEEDRKAPNGAATEAGKDQEPDLGAGRGFGRGWSGSAGRLSP